MTGRMQDNKIVTLSMQYDQHTNQSDNGRNLTNFLSEAPAAQHPEFWKNIPLELRNQPQWCMADPDKRPLTAEGLPASSTNSNTWTDFNVACQAAHSKGLGIGYMLHESDPFTCIDLDVKDAENCTDQRLHTTPEQFKRYDSIRINLDSYTEYSKSGKGLHIWVRGNIGKGCRRDGVEIYSQERFMICTGNVLNNKPIEDRQEILTNMVSCMRPTEEQEFQYVDGEEEVDDWYILRIAAGAAVIPP